jgi:hypothetical protein
MSEDKADLLRQIEALTWEEGGKPRKMIPLAEVPPEIQRALKHPDNKVDSKEYQYELTYRYLVRTPQSEVKAQLAELEKHVYHAVEEAGLKKVTESRGAQGKIVVVESTVDSNVKEFLIPIYPEGLRKKYACPFCKRDIGGASAHAAITNMRRHIEGHMKQPNP